MAQYIDKDALIAEIEKKLDKHNKLQSFNYGAVKDLESLLNFLDTLEVKEMDLDKEFEQFLDEVEGVPRMWHSDEQIEWAKDIAKHFYELGLKTLKGE